MKITIVGIGKVGYTLAENLTADGHDITVLDTDAEVLRRADDSLDVLCIRGSGASVDVLRSAGADKADMVISVTDRDELNMLCCLISKKLGAKFTAARIRDYDYTVEVGRLKRELDIDLVINPEHSTATQISRLLRFPAATDIESFYRGRVELVGFRVQENDIIAGEALLSLKKRLRGIPILFCAAEHNGETFIPNGSTVFYPGDTVYVIGEALGVDKFFKLLGRVRNKIRRVFLVGGGRISVYLAQYLTQMNMSVTVIESDRDRCRELCEILPGALIINGDGTDQALLESENITQADAFVSLTGRDEDNLITALYAKRSGISKVVAKINRQSYYGIIDQLGIDSIVSPKIITAHFMLRSIRGIDSSSGNRMEALYPIAGGKAFAAVFTAHSGTKSLGIPLKDLKLKSGMLVSLINRKGAFITPEGCDHIEENDGVIIITNGAPVSDLNDIFRE